jgi:hypothetical protein
LSRGPLSVIDSTISNNTATGGGTGIGGGIALQTQATLSISGSTVTGNVAKDQGGGISFSNGSGPHAITNTTISNNEAGVGTEPGDFSAGGGLRLVGSGLDLTIQDSFIDNNSAGVDSAPGFTSFQYGGGIEISASGSVTIENTSISGNSLTGSADVSRGGGIGLRSVGSLTVTVTDSVISGNSIDPASPFAYGGGLSVGTYSSSSTTVLTDTDLIGNSAGRGGALGSRLHFGSKALLELHGGNISGNTSLGGNGGGVMWAWSLQDSTFNGVNMSNNVSESGGGAFFNSAGIFANNPGVTNRYGNSNLTINDSTISGNTSAGFGGAFELGTSLLYYPGMYLNTVTINNSTISGNSSEMGGGAISNYDSTLLLYQVTGSGNITDQTGGFLMQQINGLYDGTNKEGFAILERSTVTLNMAGTGGGIYVSYYANATLTGSIISGNTAPGSPDLYSSVTDGFTADYSLIGDNSSSYLPPGNPDPMGNKIGTSGAPINAMLGALGDNGGPTLTHLPQAGSPAIDAGDPTVVGGTDQRGFNRVFNGRVDMGSVEYGSSMSVPLGNDRLRLHLPARADDTGGRERGAASPKSSRAHPTHTERARPISDQIEELSERRSAVPATDPLTFTLTVQAAAPAIRLRVAASEGPADIVEDLVTEEDTARVVPPVRVREVERRWTTTSPAADEKTSEAKARDLFFASLGN